MLALVIMSAPAIAAGDDVDRFRDAVARHPDDQDLAWAFARSLSDAWHEDEAIEALERLVARWPDHGPAQLQLGTLLFGQQRYAEAIAHLERAVELDPSTGAAFLLLGVAYGQIGDFDAAEHALVHAAEVDPTLRAESLLMRGAAHLEHGDTESGSRLLERAISTDPESETAYSARLLLTTLERRSRPRLRAEGYAGMDYDSNVTLDSGTGPTLSTDQSDGAGVFGAMLAGDVLTTANHTLSLGARYHERNYLELDAFDERSFFGFATGQWRLGPRLAARLSLTGSHTMLDGAPYLSIGGGRPDLLVWLGERSGVLQVAANVEAQFYADRAAFPSLERNALVFGGSVSHLFPLPGLDASRGSIGVEYERVLTRADTDMLGFEGDYDRHAIGAHTGFELELPYAVATELGAAVSADLYDNDNLIDYLTQLQTGGTAEPRRRQDLQVDARVSLARELVDHVDLEIHWRFQQRFSNTEVFDYQRQIVGATLRLHSF